MNAAPCSFSRPDLAFLGCFAICGVVAAFSSDREFLVFHQWSTEMARMPSASNPPTLAVKIQTFASRAVQNLEAVLFVISLGLALIAYRPRRGIRPRRRGPGHVALAIAGGLVSYSMAAFCWFTYGPARLTGHKPNSMTGLPPLFWPYMPHGFGHSITYGIVSAWIYLAVIGGWRKSNMPLERSGRWLGLTWIIASVVVWGIALIPRT